MMQIYIADDCPACNISKEIAQSMRQSYPNLKIDLLNLSNKDTICPDNIFATPTYILNGQVVFLGNPSLMELEICLHKAGVILIE